MYSIAASHWMSPQVEHNDEEISNVNRCFKFFREMMDSAVYLDNALLQ